MQALSCEHNAKSGYYRWADFSAVDCKKVLTKMQWMAKETVWSERKEQTWSGILRRRLSL